MIRRVFFVYPGSRGDGQWCKFWISSTYFDDFILVSVLQEEIQFLRKRENVNSIVLHQGIIGQDIDDYLFGVAAINDRNISSGVTWQDECRYVKNAGMSVTLLPRSCLLNKTGNSML